MALAARRRRARAEKTQVSAAETLLQELPRHHHALDLLGALVDLGVFGCGYRRPAQMFEVKQLTRRRADDR